jgi:hypothetical protein
VPNVLTPNAKQQFFDNNGRPMVSGRLFTYAAGTSTKIATKVSPSGANNANPIVLDFRGECNLWIEPNVAYKFVLAPPGSDDPPTQPIWTVDQLVSSQLITLWGGLDTGSANVNVLTYTANFSSYVDGTIVYWIPANTNTGGSTLNINGLGPVPILDANGFGLGAGDIIVNQITAVIYRAGSFYLLSVSTATGSFTGTLNGCTTFPTGTIFYKISGGLCTLYVNSNITGVSNVVTMSISGLPAIVRPAVQILVPCEVLNNSIAAFGAAAVGTGGSIIFQTYQVSGIAVIPGPFAAANNKGIQTGWSVTYPL